MFATELNDFYARFDSRDETTEMSKITKSIREKHIHNTRVYLVVNAHLAVLHQGRCSLSGKMTQSHKVTYLVITPLQI